MRNFFFIILLICSYHLFAVTVQSIQTKTDTTALPSTAHQDEAFLDSLSNYVFYNQAPEPVKPVESPSFTMMMVKMILSLIVITVILYLVLKFVKNLNQNQYMNSDKLIKIVDSQPLGFKQYIQIISIHKKMYIVSSSANNIQVIDKIEDTEEIKEILESKVKTNSPDFKVLFNKFKITKGNHENKR